MALMLEGIRVLDLTRILAGPWATQNLADLGAEVIKIEKPGEGDDTRHMGPPFIRNQQTGEPADAAYFLAANRGKESVAIDISTPEGRQLIRQLVAKCDILIENYKVGGLKKYGLDYDSLRAECPHLIYCSVTGFGQTGPYRQRAGYDYLIQGMGGLMSVTGERDQEPGGGPQRAGVALADIMTGMYATVAMLAALRHRDQGGGGQHIDIGMLDVQVAVLANVGMNYLTTGVVPQRMGNGHPSVVPYQSFKTLDGHVIFAVGNDAQFKRMCVAIGQAELAQQQNFSTNAARVVHRNEILEILQRIILTQTTAQWVELMESVDVPCGPINALDSVFDNPQIIAREVQQRLSHPVSGSVPTVANPIKFSETPIVYERAPPVLSQHTEAVLKRVLQLSDESLNELKTKKIIGDRP